MNMSSFLDEYIKIAASASKAKNPKTRMGRRPIRADNLLKKADARTEAVKKGLLPFLIAKKKTLGLLGAGAVGAKAIEEGIVEPMQYGYRARSAGAQF